MKISIHRALAELKLIDKKISQKIKDFRPVGLKQKDKPVNNYQEEEVFNKEANESYQSINDLIKRKIDLKTAITKANSVTTVEIAGMTMTIAEAIQYKAIIPSKESLMTEMEGIFNGAKIEAERVNANVEKNALGIAEKALAKDNVKITDQDVINVTKPYVDQHTAHIVDPICVEKEIKKLREEINQFKLDIDAVLSEINAITMIEV